MNKIKKQLKQYNIFLFIYSLLIALKFVLTQEYTYPFDDIISISEYKLEDKKQSDTHNYKLKNCPNNDRKFLITTIAFDMYFQERENKLQINQKQLPNAIEYSKNDIYEVSFQVAEICMKNVYVKTEQIQINRQDIKSFTHLSKPSNYNKNMKAIPFIIGYEVVKGTDQNSVFIENCIAKDDGFAFTFSSQFSGSVIFIDINYLYYEENIQDKYYKLELFEQTKYKTLTQQNQITINTNAKVEVTKSSFCNKSDPLKCGIILGLSGFDLMSDDVSKSDALRVRLIYQFASNLSIQYYTWNKSKILGITTKVVFFQMIRCNNNLNSITKINHNESCIDNCPSGFYQANDADRDIFICKKCGLNCKTCDKNTPDQCISCEPDYYFFQKKCLKEPPKKSYCNKNGKDQYYTCTICSNPQCDFCDKQNNCTLCSSLQYEFESKCYSQQPQSTYCQKSNDFYECKKCQNDCAECKNATECTECKENYYLVNNKCQVDKPQDIKCKKQDNYDFYTCIECKEHCTWCSQQECTSCEEKFYLIEKSCEQNQPSNADCKKQDDYFTCTLCPQNCTSCNLQVCTSCEKGYYLFEEKCLKEHPKKSYCDKNDKDFYTCTNCKSECHDYCDQKQNCVLCQSSLYELDNQCYSKQPESTFCELLYGIYKCSKCQSDCIECNKATECTSCKQNYYLVNNKCQVDKPQDIKCKKQDNNDFYTCIKCQEHCTWCSQQECTSCEEKFYLIEKSCEQNQPSNADCKKQDDYFTCTLCPQNCTSCNLQVCTSCEKGYYLFEEKCLKEHPKKSYCDKNDKDFYTCTNCKSECHDYCDQKQNCVLCSPSQFEFDNQCYSKQPESTFCELQNGNNKCQKCQNDCTECSNLTECTKCKENYYLVNNACQVNMPQDLACKKQDNETFYTCIKCEENCTWCSEKECTSCKENFYLLDKKCLQTKPSKTDCIQKQDGYFDCKRCPQNCTSCDSKGCTQCEPEHYLLDNKCSETEPFQTHCKFENRYYNCNKCSNLQCSRHCDEKNVCINCLDNNQYYYQNKCFDEQPKKTFKKEDEYFDCHKTCQTCKDSNEDSCLSCDNIEFILEKSNCKCKDPKKGIDTATQKCEQCSIIGCAKCTDNIQQCDICENKFVLVNNKCECKETLKLNGSTCECIDEVGMDYNPSTEKCECKSDLIFDIQTQKCKCSDSSMYFDSKSKSCTKNQQTKHCEETDPYSQKCIKCESGYKNNEGRCKLCGGGKYANSNNECSNKCQENCLLCKDEKSCKQFDEDMPCHVSCLVCSLPNSSTSCTSCGSSTRILDEINNTCKCKEGYEETQEKDCKKIDNEQSESLGNYLDIVFKTSYYIQLPILFFPIYPYVQYQFMIQQQVGILSYLYEDNDHKNIRLEQLSLYKNYNFKFIDQLSIISAKNESNQNMINQIFIIYMIFSITIASSLIINRIKQLNKNKYLISISQNSFIIAVRLLSTIGYYFIACLLSQPSELSVVEIIFVVIFALILVYNYVNLVQVCRQVDKNKKLIKMESNLTQNSPFLASIAEEKNEKVQYQYESMTNNICMKVYNKYIIWIIYEIRKVFIVLSFFIFKESKAGILIPMCISCLFVIGLLYFKVFSKRYQIILTALSEIFLIIVLILSVFTFSDDLSSDRKYITIIDYCIIGVLLAQQVVIIVNCGMLYFIFVKSLVSKFTSKPSVKMNNRDITISMNIFPKEFDASIINQILNSTQTFNKTMQNRKTIAQF